MVAFRGSIDPIGAHELLRRVAAHDDPGMLTISDDRATHVVWFGHGDIVCAAPDAPADVVARILDGDGGTFLFEADRAAPRPGVRAPFAETLDVARSLHDELAELIACVPSPAHQVRWTPRLPAGPVEIDAGTWSLLVAIAAMPTTSALAEREGSDLLARRAVRRLAATGLVEVFEAEVPSPVIVPDRSARRRPADLDVDPDLEFAMLPPADLFFSELPSNTDEPVDDSTVGVAAMVLVEVASMDGGEQLVHEVDAAAASIDPGDLSDWHVSEDNLVIDESGWATSRPLATATDEIDEIDEIDEPVDVDEPDEPDAAEPDADAPDEAWASDGWGDAWGHEPAPVDEPVGWGDAAPDEVDEDGTPVEHGWDDDATIELVDRDAPADLIDESAAVPDGAPTASNDASTVGMSPFAALASPPTPIGAIGPAPAADSPVVPVPHSIVPPPPAPVAPADKVVDDVDDGETSPTDDELLSRAQIYRFLSSMRS